LTLLTEKLTSPEHADARHARFRRSRQCAGAGVVLGQPQHPPRARARRVRRRNKEWLRVYRLPAYALDLNPAGGIWLLLKQSMVNFAAADLNGLVRIVKRKLKKIQYRPYLIDGCLAATGLTIEPWRAR
jgi:hypothetical protein